MGASCDESGGSFGRGWGVRDDTDGNGGEDWVERKTDGWLMEECVVKEGS